MCSLTVRVKVGVKLGLGLGPGLGSGLQSSSPHGVVNITFALSAELLFCLLSFSSACCFYSVFIPRAISKLSRCWENTEPKLSTADGALFDWYDALQMEPRLHCHTWVLPLSESLVWKEDPKPLWSHIVRTLSISCSSHTARTLWVWGPFCSECWWFSHGLLPTLLCVVLIPEEITLKQHYI